MRQGEEWPQKSTKKREKKKTEWFPFLCLLVLFCGHSFSSQRRVPAGLGPLDAAARRREHLVRRTAVVRVERRPQPQHLAAVRLVEQLRQEVQLLDADAVLAGHTAAAGDALVR